MQNLLLSLVDIKLRSFGGFPLPNMSRAMQLPRCLGVPFAGSPGGRMPRIRRWRARALQDALPRKEVIQPHLPVRLPCYDFTPLTLHTFDASAPERVRPAASGADDSGGVTGGVYKARERIHRGVLIRDY